jgi:hypothetical protein
MDLNDSGRAVNTVFYCISGTISQSQKRLTTTAITSEAPV